MRKTVAERILDNIEIDDNGCWNWTKSKSHNGYGKIKVEYRDKRAHRVSYEMYNGPFDDSLDVLHTCDNPACCNPTHLFLGDHQDNMNDKVAKQRQVRGERVNTAKVNESTVRLIRAAQGTCIDIAKQFGISKSIVKNIRTKRSWAHVT